MSASFKTFAEDVLVTAGGMQREKNSYSVDLLHVLGRLDWDPWDSWNEQVIPYLVDNSWAEDDSTLAVHRIRVTGPGFTRIDEIHEERRPRSIKDHVRSFTRSDWIAFGAFTVSVIALFK